MVELWTLMLIVLAVIGSTGLFGGLVYVIARVRRLEASRPIAGGVDAIRELERIQERLGSVEGEVQALSEKVEFTERLLEGGTPGPSHRAEDNPG